jgi:hypothetical protein
MRSIGTILHGYALYIYLINTTLISVFTCEYRLRSRYGYPTILSTKKYWLGVQLQYEAGIAKCYIPTTPQYPIVRLSQYYSPICPRYRRATSWVGFTVHIKEVIPSTALDGGRFVVVLSSGVARGADRPGRHLCRAAKWGGRKLFFVNFA